jgi:D-tyrosyl-tRNA(Tyr) deacylase
MRAVVQRVTRASVEVDAVPVGSIGKGLLVYLGAGKDDDDRVAPWMASKLLGLRIFEDDAGKMNRSVVDVAGSLLVVSQFTLYGDVRSGKRPGFDTAARPERAQQLYEQVCSALRTQGASVATGQFRASMQVMSQVDGPVTILVDSDRVF